MNISNCYILKDTGGVRLTTSNSFISAYEKASVYKDCAVIEKVSIKANEPDNISTVWKKNHFDCYI